MTAKRPCNGEKMSGAVQAREWGNELTRRESRGPGDMENAWRRLEARSGIPWRLFWSLRYRLPNVIDHDLWERLRQFYEAECARQARLLKHEAEITKALHPSAAAIREAEALADEEMA